MLVDSHCHLDFPDYGEDVEEVVARARRAGVGTMVSISTHLSRFDGVRARAARVGYVWCTGGGPPHHAGVEVPDGPGSLIALAAHPKVVGIGESGLDYHYDNSPRDVQAASFRHHIAAARETGLPLVVHARDADEDVAAILREGMEEDAYCGVMHCFSSGRGLAEAALDMGFHVSFSGIVTFRNADELRAIARDVPLERMLVETDAPFLAPVPNRGKRNEPAFVVHTAEVLAEVKGIAPDELAARTSENFFRLFARARPPAAAVD